MPTDWTPTLSKPKETRQKRKAVPLTRAGAKKKKLAADNQDHKCVEQTQLRNVLMDLYLKKITLQTAVTMMHGRLSEASIRGKLKAMAPNLVQDADRWQVLRSANSVAGLVEKRCYTDHELKDALFNAEKPVVRAVLRSTGDDIEREYGVGVSTLRK